MTRDLDRLTAVLVSAVLLAGCAEEPGSETPPPIIDMHVHAYGANPSAAAPCYVPCDDPPRAAATDEELFDTTLAAMDAHNIVLAYLIGDPPMLERWSEAAPGRFFTSVRVIEAPPRPSVDALREAHEAGLLQGIGEVGTQYWGTPPNDPTLEPYFALAEELDVPLLIHTVGIGARRPGFRSAAGNPLLLEDAIVRHPNLRLSVENAGWPFADEMIALMYQYPNVYADLSTISWIIPRNEFYTYLRRLMHAELGDRLMFGTDAVYWPEAIHQSVEAIENAWFLSEEEKRGIFYNNAVRFLRLDSLDTFAERDVSDDA